MRFLVKLNADFNVWICDSSPNIKTNFRNKLNKLSEILKIKYDHKPSFNCKEAIFFQPWLIILPGIALFTLVVSINMLGDGLRDISDPNSKVSEEWVSF